MTLTKLSLSELVEKIHNSRSFKSKRNIQIPSEIFANLKSEHAIWNGDDAAAIPDGENYLLLAAEGIIPSLIKANPYLAGRSAVLANVNDIYAMGGRPVAMVDVIASGDSEITEEICHGVKDNANRFRVPLVGGHTIAANTDPSLALAILGKAKKLITSFDAQPGDLLALAYNPDGEWMGKFGFWNSTSKRDDTLLIGDRELLPQAAEADLVVAGKDVSFSGIAGTALMLAEASKCGLMLDLEIMPKPESKVEMNEWLTAYFSFGFLLAVKEKNFSKLEDMFRERSLTMTSIGHFIKGSSVIMKQQSETALLWDWAKKPYTGFSKP